MKIIEQIQPSYGEEEISAIVNYLRQEPKPYLTEYTQARTFENDIAKFVGAKHCSATANGTVAISLALSALGIGKGDQVIVPDYTFVASATACEAVGAEPVFCDIEKETLCLDFARMKKAITKKTKAIILVSMNGRYPTKMKEIIDYCHGKGIFVVEDAAQSLGSECNGKYLGTLGDIGCYSFSMPKIITTGQGGACVTNSTALYERMKRIRNFGRDGQNSDHFVMKGWNFKTTDLQSVIGIEQLKKLPERVVQKMKINLKYAEGLVELKQIKILKPQMDEGSITALCAMDILLENKDDRTPLMNFLKEAGIQTRAFYPPLHKEPYDQKGSFKVTEDICARGLWLPSSLNLTDEEIKYICGKIKEYFGA